MLNNEEKYLNLVKSLSYKIQLKNHYQNRYLPICLFGERVSRVKAIVYLVFK